MCDFAAAVLLGISASGGSDSRISLTIDGLSRHVFRNHPVLISHDDTGWLGKVGLGRPEGNIENAVSGDAPDGFRDSRIGHVIVAQDADDRKVDTDRI